MNTPEQAARAKLFAVAGERWPGTQEETHNGLKAFLRVESLSALADHLMTPKEDCQDTDCARPHGVASRAECWRTMTRWLEAAPGSAAEAAGLEAPQDRPEPVEGEPVEAIADPKQEAML